MFDAVLEVILNVIDEFKYNKYFIIKAYYLSIGIWTLVSML